VLVAGDAAGAEPGVFSDVIEVNGLALADGSVASGLSAAFDLFRPHVANFHHDVPPEAIGVVKKRGMRLVWNVHGHAGCMSGHRYFRPGNDCERPHSPACLANLTFRNCGHRKVPRPSGKEYQRVSSELRALRQADHVLVYSSWMQRLMRINGIARVGVIAPYVSAGRPYVATGHARRVLYVGRVTPPKGVLVLLRAVARIPDATLVICGDGFGRRAVRSEISKNDLQDRVSYLGWQPDAVVAEQYRLASVVAVAPLLAEPFGLTGIEAMSHGRAVVGTAVGGIPEWLEDGKTGILVQPGDVGALGTALRRLLDDEELRTRMGANAAATAATRYGMERFAHETEQALIGDTPA
jgi:glycosyltransferase involved in cell wall biosynthesis